MVGLNVTRLDGDVGDSEVFISGYKIFRSDRNSNGGGVSIYVKVTIPEPTIKVQGDILELLCLEVTPKYSKTFLSHTDTDGLHLAWMQWYSRF